MKKYIGARQLAEKWGVTERRIRLMCQEGRIEGAVKLGWSWSIPADVPKPYDGRHMRTYKNSCVRLGSIDIDGLNSLRDTQRVRALVQEDRALDAIASGLLCLGAAMDGVPMDRGDILQLWTHGPVRGMSYQDCLKASSFRSVLLRSPFIQHEASVRGVLDLHAAFTQGRDDIGGMQWRRGFVVDPKGDDGLRVDLQMETFLMQFDREWKGLHPVFRSALLLSGLVQSRPFDEDNCAFAVLASSALLMSEGLLPPTMDEDDLNELKATLALASGKGVYEDLARMMERCIIASYESFGQRR